MFWNEDGKLVKQEVPAQGETFRESTITGEVSPTPIYIQAFTKGTNQSVMLNNQLVFPVIATEVSRTINVVLGEGRHNK